MVDHWAHIPLVLYLSRQQFEEQQWLLSGLEQEGEFCTQN